MKFPRRLLVMLLLSLVLPAGAADGAGNQWTVVAWNDLGMHCMDADYSVFAILPPFNTIHAQLIDTSGQSIKDPNGIVMTYQPVADPAGSVNSSSRWKTNFWGFVQQLFGVQLRTDMGLSGSPMPGLPGRAEPMRFDAERHWFTAEGIPITNYDDHFDKNFYPMMRIAARSSNGEVLATTDIVLPVSDEMDCRLCHGSGTVVEPGAGWVWDSDADKDFKLNILRVHDERRLESARYRSALATAGYTANGLCASATQEGKPVLCAHCHSSNALPGNGVDGLPPLTNAIHSLHARAIDPGTGLRLDANGGRSACYTCHPGSETRCLRGVMGSAAAAGGVAQINCQDCHGSMSQVGAARREGWFDEPNCQSCHTGLATWNNGQIRYTSAFEPGGGVRQAVMNRFATQPDTPAPGVSLYRFSAGHGGLQCAACHGSTHAIYPSSHENDNVQNVSLQSQAGTLGECSVCHRKGVRTVTGGPHGMHPVGDEWVEDHEDAAERDRTGCQDCHGKDYRGTVLSRALRARSMQHEWGTLNVWKGFQVSCYACHDGPNSERRATNIPPAAIAVNAATESGLPVDIQLNANDVDGDDLTMTVVTQPRNGVASLENGHASYHPFAGFEGSDSFTFAAWDGLVHSNLATVTVVVTAQTRPAFPAEGVVSAASYAGGGIAPGELIAIYGTMLGPERLTTLQLISGGVAQKSLAGTKVLFDGETSPLVYTSGNVVTAMAPYSLQGKVATDVVVEYQGIRSSAVNIGVVDQKPALLTRDSSGTGLAAALNSDHSLHSLENPASRGDVIVLYGVGAGIRPSGEFDGLISPTANAFPAGTVRVRIGGVEATLEYAGAAPSLISGAIQINARVPANIEPGDAVPVEFEVGGTVSQPGVTIAVR